MDAETEEVEDAGFIPVAAPTLLNIPPVLLHIVRAFMPLKDTLSLRNTCVELHNDEFAAFRHCHLDDDEQSRQSSQVDGERVVHNGIGNFRLAHLRSQDRTLVNGFRYVNKLRALLQNETFHSSYIDWTSQKYISGIINNGENDSPSVALLVNDGRFHPFPKMYYNALKKDQLPVARALEQEDFIRTRIASNICVSCHELPACYKCCNGVEGCVNFEEPLSPAARQNAEGELPEQYIGIMYCRACVRAANWLCIGCDNTVCPQCFEDNKYFSCMECHAIICNRWWCKDSPFYESCTLIEDCNRAICTSCIPQSQERRWHKINGVVDGEAVNVTCCGGDECCGDACTAVRENGVGFQWL